MTSDAIQHRPATSAPRNGRRPGLTREQGLTAALKHPPPAPVVEQVFTLVGLGDPGSAQHGDWEDVLRRTAHTFRRIALTHPHVVPLLVTRTLSCPLARRPLGTLRPLEALLELFITAGFDHH